MNCGYPCLPPPVISAVLGGLGNSAAEYLSDLRIRTVLVEMSYKRCCSLVKCIYMMVSASRSSGLYQSPIYKQSSHSNEAGDMETKELARTKLEGEHQPH